MNPISRLASLAALSSFAYALLASFVLLVSSNLVGAGETSSAEASARESSPAAPKPSSEESSDDRLSLTPFEVKASGDLGYAATDTLSGSRMSTPLKDIATQVTVMTPEYLADLAIPSLDDAMLYSLNTENDQEIINVSDRGATGAEATTQPFNAGGRTRGLGASNRAHDFFDTQVKIDSYNTERFTFSSGPNSILFGNSNPAGTIDTTFKRPNYRRSNLSVSNRVDGNESFRVSSDLNVPISKDKIALRVATLIDRQKDWRDPAFENQDRVYLTLGYRPNSKIGVRLYHEAISSHSNPARNTLVLDNITPWKLAGSPTFNNGGTGGLPAVAMPFGRINTNNYYYTLDGSGVLLPFAQLNNSVGTNGFDSITPPPNDFGRTVIDESVYPYDKNFSGNGDQSKVNAWIRGAILELNPIRNLYIEAGANQESYKHHGVDLFNGQASSLYVDANAYLNDRVTPNPNFGRYYFIDGVPINQKNYSEKEQMRLSVSYDLDLRSKPGWLRHLGRQRVALLLDHLDAMRVSERSDFRYWDGTTFRIVNFRYYISPDHLTVDLPFDPLASGKITLPDVTTLAGNPVEIVSWDPSVAQNLLVSSRSVVDSRALAWQGYLLKDRLVLSYGVRRDDVTVYNAPTLATNWDFLAMARGDIPWAKIQNDAPVTSLKSVVLHPFDRISLSFAKSSSEQVTPDVRRELDGTLATFGAGEGTEFGVTLRLSSKIGLRASYYENQADGVPSAYRAALPTGRIAANGQQKGNIIRNDVGNIESTVLLAGAPKSTKYAYYQDDLLATFPDGSNTGGDFQNRYDLLADRAAKGYEVTLIGNPTPNLRVSVGFAMNTTKEANIGTQYFDFIKERLPIWATYKNQPIAATPAITIGQLLPVAMQSWNYIRQAEGSANQMERKYRGIGTIRYGFTKGILKSAFIGSTYSWRSPAIVGYKTKIITDNEFETPGITFGSLAVNDLEQPIRGKPLTSFDAFCGWQYKFKRNFTYRVQLNVRNVLDRDGLLVQRALTTGEGAIYTAQQPRLFILTNTVGF